MKINEIIKERRLSKGLTQEQVAAYLGVSTPAVNKWEKAISYPDITLLPALARLLGTDLNTLLSFKEDLTNIEINKFSNELMAIASEKGIDRAFEIAMNKIYEYPNCDSLILITAATLEGIVQMFQAENTYEEKIESLYMRIINSNDLETSNTAKALLISKYINKENYDKAEELLNSLPDDNNFDKSYIKSKLYIKQGKLEDAGKTLENKLTINLANIQTYLLMLMEIAEKEGRFSDIKYISEVAENSAQLFGLNKWTSSLSQLHRYTLEKNTTEFFNTMKKMLLNINTLGEINKSPLRYHSKLTEFKNNNSKEKENSEKLILKSIISDLNNTNKHELDFLRNSTEFEEFMAWIKNKFKVQ